MFAIKVETPPDDVKGVGEAKKIFDAVSRERRQRIVTAVFRGEPLAEPEDARLAVAYARTLTRPPGGWRRWLHRLTAVGAAVYLLVELVIELRRRAGWEMPDTTTIVVFFYLVAHVSGWIAARHTRKKALRAEELNLEVAGLADVPIPVPRPSSRRWQPEKTAERRERNWRPHLFGGLAAIGIIALGAWSEDLVLLLLAVILGAYAAQAIEAYPRLTTVERIVLWWSAGAYALLCLSFAKTTPGSALAAAAPLAGLGLFVLLNVHQVADRLAKREVGLWILKTTTSARHWRFSAAVLTLFAIVWGLDPGQHP